MLSNFVFPIALVLIGYLLKRFSIVKEGCSDVVIRLVYYVFLPATLFYSLSRLELKEELLFIPLSGFLIALTCYGFAYLTRGFYNLDRGGEGVYVIASGAMNQALFTYPLFLLYNGAEGLSYVAFFDVGQAILGLTFGYYLASAYGKNHLTQKAIMQNMLRFPPLIAIIISLIVNLSSMQDELQAVYPFVEMLASCTTPLIMIALGLFLKPKLTNIKAMGGVLFNRFVFALAVAYVLVNVAGIEGLAKTTILIASAAPPAMVTLVYASEEKLDIEYTTGILSVGIIIALLYLPILFSTVG